MRVNDMNMEQLKAELKRRSLSMAGNKQALKERLYEAWQREGLNPNELDFDLETSVSEDDNDVTIVKQPLEEEVAVVKENPTVSSGSFDVSQLMAVMQQMMSEQKTMKNEIMAEQNKMEEKIMIKQQDSDNALKQLQENLLLEQQTMKNELILEQQKKQNLMNEKVREMSVGLNCKVEKLEERIVSVDQKLEQNTMEIEQQIELIKREISDIKVNGPTAPITQSVPGFKLKPPTFDGTTSFNIFKFQFETALNQNNWNDKDRVAALIVALKGEAPEAIQTIPEHDRYKWK